MYPKWKMDPSREVNFSKMFKFWATQANMEFLWTILQLSRLQSNLVNLDFYVLN